MSSRRNKDDDELSDSSEEVKAHENVSEAFADLLRDVKDPDFRRDLEAQLAAGFAGGSRRSRTRVRAPSESEPDVEEDYAPPRRSSKANRGRSAESGRKTPTEPKAIKRPAKLKTPRSRPTTPTRESSTTPNRSNKGRLSPFDIPPERRSSRIKAERSLTPEPRSEPQRPSSASRSNKRSGSRTPKGDSTKEESPRVQRRISTPERSDQDSASSEHPAKRQKVKSKKQRSGSESESLAQGDTDLEERRSNRLRSTKPAVKKEASKGSSESETKSQPHEQAKEKKKAAAKEAEPLTQVEEAPAKGESKQKVPLKPKAVQDEPKETPEAEAPKEKKQAPSEKPSADTSSPPAEKAAAPAKEPSVDVSKEKEERSSSAASAAPKAKKPQEDTRKPAEGKGASASDAPSKPSKADKDASNTAEPQGSKPSASTTSKEAAKDRSEEEPATTDEVETKPADNLRARKKARSPSPSPEHASSVAGRGGKIGLEKKQKRPPVAASEEATPKVGNKEERVGKAGVAKQTPDRMETKGEQPWVLCDRCKQWRKLPKTVDASELPSKWFCSMNKWDPARSSCDAPEDKEAREDPQYHKLKEAAAGEASEAVQKAVVSGRGRRGRRGGGVRRSSRIGSGGETPDSDEPKRSSNLTNAEAALFRIKAIEQAVNHRLAQTPGPHTTIVIHTSDINWVICDKCEKWRAAPLTADLEALPKQWFCHMNRWDPHLAMCSKPNPRLLDRLSNSDSVEVKLPTRKNREKDATGSAPAKRQRIGKSGKLRQTPTGTEEVAVGRRREPAVPPSGSTPSPRPSRRAALPTTSRAEERTAAPLANRGAAAAVAAVAASRGSQPVESENWVQCDACKKWRKLPATVDTSQLPKKWYCRLNYWDRRYNSCDQDQQPTTEPGGENGAISIGTSYYKTTSDPRKTFRFLVYGPSMMRTSRATASGPGAGRGRTITARNLEVRFRNFKQFQPSQAFKTLSAPLPSNVFNKLITDALEDAAKQKDAPPAAVSGGDESAKAATAVAPSELPAPAPFLPGYGLQTDRLFPSYVKETRAISEQVVHASKPHGSDASKDSSDKQLGLDLSLAQYVQFPEELSTPCATPAAKRMNEDNAEAMQKEAAASQGGKPQQPPVPSPMSTPVLGEGAWGWTEEHNKTNPLSAAAKSPDASSLPLHWVSRAAAGVGSHTMQEQAMDMWGNPGPYVRELIACRGLLSSLIWLGGRGTMTDLQKGLAHVHAAPATAATDTFPSQWEHRVLIGLPWHANELKLRLSHLVRLGFVVVERGEERAKKQFQPKVVVDPDNSDDEEGSDSDEGSEDGRPAEDRWASRGLGHRLRLARRMPLHHVEADSDSDDGDHAATDDRFSGLGVRTSTLMKRVLGSGGEPLDANGDIGSLTWIGGESGEPSISHIKPRRLWARGIAPEAAETVEQVYVLTAATAAAVAEGLTPRQLLPSLSSIAMSSSSASGGSEDDATANGSHMGSLRLCKPWKLVRSINSTWDKRGHFKDSRKKKQPKTETIGFAKENRWRRG